MPAQERSRAVCLEFFKVWIHLREKLNQAEGEAEQEVHKQVHVANTPGSRVVRFNVSFLRATAARLQLPQAVEADRSRTRCCRELPFLRILDKILRGKKEKSCERATFGSTASGPPVGAAAAPPLPPPAVASAGAAANWTCAPWSPAWLPRRRVRPPRQGCDRSRVRRPSSPVRVTQTSAEPVAVTLTLTLHSVPPPATVCAHLAREYPLLSTHDQHTLTFTTPRKLFAVIDMAFSLITKPSGSISEWRHQNDTVRVVKSIEFMQPAFFRS